MKLNRRWFLKDAAASSAVATADALFPGVSFGNWQNLTNNSGVISWQKAPCRFCGTGCGVLVGVSDGRAVAVKGDPNCSVNKGLCCMKGYHSVQMISGKDRITTAKVRKNGEMVEVPIKEALDLIAEKIQETKDLRQYPGSPPRIPHEVELMFSGDETDCLSCHAKGGYSQEFSKFVPVTPHPENSLCYQCHAQVLTEEKFVETEWKSIMPPRLGRSFLGGSPPPIPHGLQMRENCISCHTGPGAVVEIRVDHSARGNCRQCHAPAVQTTPLQEFVRKP